MKTTVKKLMVINTNNGDAMDGRCGHWQVLMTYEAEAVDDVKNGADQHNIHSRKEQRKDPVTVNNDIADLTIFLWG